MKKRDKVILAVMILAILIGIAQGLPEAFPAVADLFTTNH